MIFQYDLEPVLIWRILIGFAAILEIILTKFEQQKVIIQYKVTLPILETS